MFDPSARLFMRFRGKMTGPFSLAQIEQMRQLGRVTAFHEVSIDGVQWILAVDAGLVTSASMGQNSAPLGTIPQSAPVASSNPEWYYLDASGERLGPIVHEQIVEMIAGGKLTASSEVWSEGFADWVSLAKTELAGFVPHKQSLRKGTTQLVSDPDMALPGGNGLVVAGYLFCVGAVFLCPPLFGIAALTCAIFNLSRRRVAHGLIQLFLSIVLSSAGAFLWYLVWQQIDR